ncbi:hypothetical protein M422DRAFT_33642 [Sphaerobolus stellatus SS14]|uniref:4-coumarate--CoA ligase n=1 Tax=Sphaerobolus stellatus (strain SS14) TaxID=990650 RepID=A0A0C9U3S2_SPHS4|nr:hypothetical protein M422DRAFT_33642 [Sphaerobolus stellatus SS14]
MSDFKWSPARSLKECDAIMTAPGQFHEIEHAVIDNRVYRVWKHLPPSLREFWTSAVTNRPDLQGQDYIVFEDTRITYGQADEMVQKLASIFREVYGVRKGDRVGIAMRNYPEWIISFWAAAILGAIPTAINAWLPITPFMHCVKLTSPKVLILDQERVNLINSELPSLHTSVILVRPTSNKPIRGVRVKEYNHVIASYNGSTSAWQKESACLPDDNATIFFTSGTTGLPKGVLSTQRGWLGNMFNAIYAARRRELRNGTDLPAPIGQGPEPSEKKPKNNLVAIPLFHVTACTSQMVSLFYITTALGGKLVLMRKWNKFEGAKLIRQEAITGFTGVPGIVYDLFDTDAVGNTELEGVGTGGAPAADHLPSEVKKTWPNAIAQQGYGLSESNSIAVQVMGEDYLARPASTGLPPPVVDLLIVDPQTSKVLPTGEIGELWIRGPNIMRGYWNNPKATEEAITRDGWFKTGDLATLDEDGFVYIKDRVKDMIIRGGENIHSVIVENALFSDERVHDCAVVGIPDKRLGELVAALVVLRREHVGKVTEEDLLELVRPQLPAFALPSLIVIQKEEIERNAAGKTLKREIRKDLAKEWEKRNKGAAKAKL